MSDGSTPPPGPILGPPQRNRGVRRLGSRPYYIVGVCAAGFVGIAGYAIHATHETKPAAQAPANTAGNADPNVILAGMPGAGAIPAADALRKRGISTPPPRNRPAAAAPETPAPAEPPVDEVRQAALKQAWTKYYQDKAQLADKRRDDARAALVSDSVLAGTSDAGGQAQPSQAQTAAGTTGSGAANGAAPGQRGRTSLPGDLYQGPSKASDDYLQATVTPPITPYELKAGDPIQIRFVTGVTSDAPGSFRAVVTQNVVDHATGLHILIPQGSFVVGSANNTQELGTERLPAGATRIIYPGEQADSLDLGSMPLADQAGYAGLQDDVNHHYPRLIFGTLLLALGGAGAQLTQPQTNGYGGYNAQQILSAQLGQSFGQVGAQFAQQQLNAKATHTIRPGYTALLQLTQDIAFPGEWIDGRMVMASAR